jgi:hypothetical protein
MDMMRKFSMLKHKFRFLLTILLGCLLSIGLPTSSTHGDSSGDDPNALNSNGIRNDVQAYIDSVYPHMTKKKKALESYAQKLQYAHTKVNTEAEAMNFQPKKIRSLSCISMLGDELGLNSPTREVLRRTINTLERFEASYRYGEFLGGKSFVIRDPDDTPETVCDFDLNSFPD